MNDAKELLARFEQIRKNLNEDFADETISEETLQDEVPNSEVEIKPEFTDDMTTADKLSIKTKIARSLEYLKDALDDFKDATAEKIDLLNDSILLGAIEGLDTQIQAIEGCLAPEDVVDTPLNEPFGTELAEEPDEDIMGDVEFTDDMESETTDTETDSDEDTEEMNIEEEEPDFDIAAGLNLLNNAADDEE